MARASIAFVALLVALVAPAAMGATNFTFSEHDLASEEALSALYERWCAHHGLTPDIGERARRFSIFKDKARVVHEFNLGDAPYKLALNHLSDTRGYGGRCVFFNDMEVARRPRTRKHGADDVAASELPAAIDWRKCEVLPPVKNQNQGRPCGSCWAFAAVSAVEGIFAIKNNSVTALSEQQVLDCAGPEWNCSGGSVMGAFEYVYKQGLATEHDYPYEADKSICDDNDPDYRHVAFINDWETLPAHSPTALMRRVARQPVAVLIAANMTLFEQYDGGVFVGPCDGKNHTHAVTVVGYGATAGGSNYWILRNSWGRNWGEGGYMLMSRDVGGPEGLCGILDYPMFPSCAGNCNHKWWF